MASDQGFVDFVVDGLEEDCGVRAKKMFGEYGLFSRGKMFGLICDDQLFIKKTEGGQAYIGGQAEMAAPYPGAKPIFLVRDRLEDWPWLSELVRITTRELPEPKKRKKKA